MIWVFMAKLKTVLEGKFLSGAQLPGSVQPGGSTSSGKDGCRTITTDLRAFRYRVK